MAYGAAYGGVALALGGGPLAATAGNRLLFGPALNRVFWSGAGYFGAKEYAEMTSGSTLQMTNAGRVLSFLTKPQDGGFGFDYLKTMKPWWESASQRFAEGAEGPVLMFQGVNGYTGPIWNNIESIVLAARNIPVYSMPF